MNRFKLLLAAAILLTTTFMAGPAKSDGCILQGLCRSCIGPTPGYQEPCKYNPCTGEYVCGSCTNHCILPPV